MMIIVVNFFYLHPSDREWRAETDCHSKHHSVPLSLQCLLQGVGHLSHLLYQVLQYTAFSSPLERIRTCCEVGSVLDALFRGKKLIHQRWAMMDYYPELPTSIFSFSAPGLQV
jgi:hypothetical protein